VIRRLFCGNISPIPREIGRLPWKSSQPGHSISFAKKGARWLLRAAEQGYAPAQCDLGAVYVKGAGVEQSYQDALKWLRKAAEQGDALAQHSLGSIYGKGFRDKSVGFFYRAFFANATRDYVEAYKWFTLAAKNRHEQSLKDRAFIAKMWMKDYQIARAEQLIREFEQGIKT
jgi:uncharacterized protein